MTTIKRINLDNDAKTKKKEKDLTVKPYRHQLEECKSSLKQKLKVGQQTSVTDVTALATQAGGHGAGEEGKVGLLVSGQDHVLKPVQNPPRGLREVAFYENISTSTDPECEQWRDLAPHFYGLETVTMEDGTTSQYLKLGTLKMYSTYLFLYLSYHLENLTGGMTRPCVLDIKVGKITYGPDATAEKIAKTKKSYIGTREPFGFSVCGLVVNSGEGMTRLDKKYGKSLCAETIHTVVENYIGGKNAQAHELANYFIKKLKDIEVFFEKQTAYHVFGSSLLFIYDQGSPNTISAQVRLIDFAHSFGANGKIDENYLFGLRNVRKLFETFIETKPNSL